MLDFDITDFKVVSRCKERRKTSQNQKKEVHTWLVKKFFNLQIHAFNEAQQAPLPVLILEQLFLQLCPSLLLGTDLEMLDLFLAL